MKNTFIGMIAGLAIAAAPAITSEKIDTEINAKIRAEAENNSQIMKTMHFLTDVHGPRLTGSPNFKAAAEWTVKQMTEWGFTNGKLEPWDFVNADGTPRPGWLNERFSAHIISPVKDSLVGEVLAWTPSTKGTVTTEAVHVVAPTRPDAGRARRLDQGHDAEGQGQDRVRRRAHQRAGEPHSAGASA